MMSTLTRSFWIGCATLALIVPLSRADGQKPLAEADVLKLLELEIESKTIVDKVEKEGIKFSITAESLDRLKKAGASDDLLAALQKAGQGKASTAAPKTVTYQDVLKLLELGIDEKDILKRLEESFTHFVLDERQVEELKKAGASDNLLTAMREKRAQTEPVSDITDFALILDCSGSMMDQTKEGLTKMETAKKAVSEMVGKIPDGRRVAFIIYGHDKDLKCEAVKVAMPLAAIDSALKSQLKDFIAGLQPSGHTPIALALRTAGEELAKSKSACQVVLITDGMETCHGDPGKEAAQLAEKLKLPHGLQIIGFDVDPKEREVVEEIAKAGKGKYFDARSSVELIKATEEVVQKPAATEEVRNIRGVRIVKPALEFPAMKMLAVTPAYSGSGMPDTRYAPGGAYYKEFKEVTKYGELVRFPSTEPFDIWFIPADGMPVIMSRNLTIKERKTFTIKPEQSLGMVRVTGDGKVKLLALVDSGHGPDSRYGPGGSYYLPRQTGKAYGQNMIVPAGPYDLWLQPADGGKASLLEEKVEVKAGKVTEVAN